jgi:hypothetical protein
MGSILIYNFEAFCQESKTSCEIFLLCDFSLQSYTENDLTNSYPLIEKDTRSDFDKTYGFGSQIVYELNSYLSAQFGLGFKYTSLDFWFNSPGSSQSQWYFFAEEEVTLTHLFAPISLFFQSHRNRKFRVRPGLTIEPNMLINKSSSLTTRNDDLLSLVYEPEGSPNKVFGLFSIDLKCSYEFKNSSEIFTTFKIHNFPKYFNESLGMTGLPIGFRINIGYKFKPHQE